MYPAKVDALHVFDYEDVNGVRRLADIVSKMSLVLVL
jgi:hypothetical protein